MWTRLALFLPLAALAALAAAPLPVAAPVPHIFLQSRAARADLERVAPADRASAWYFDLSAVPVKDLPDWQSQIDLWINSFSRESEITKAVRVSPTLLRIDCLDYSKHLLAVRDAFTADPYYYADVQADGVTVRATSPFADPKAMAVLIEGTQCKAPIVRGDWWLVQVTQAEDRESTGYYDLLGVKNRDDFDGLTGLDKKLAEKLQKETRVALRRSGVAVNNRGIVRYQTITGGQWRTLDSNKNTGKNNALKNLNGDLDHDAEELYGALPNGLPAFLACDAKGVLQKVVPTKIAGNAGSRSNDLNIHIGGGCVSCHVEVIRPIDDWSRKVYRLPLLLVDKDKERLRRLKRLYLSDLEKHIRRDQEDFGAAIFKASGQVPAEVSATYTRLHDFYLNRDVSLKDAARDLGIAAERIHAALKRVATLTPPLDPVFAGWLADPEEPVRREHYEEGVQLLLTYIVGPTAVIPVPLVRKLTAAERRKAEIAKRKAELEKEAKDRGK